MTLNPKAAPDHRLEGVESLVRRLNLDDAPILAGPWYSELGFEVMYWTPFLAMLASKVTGFTERTTVLTRGGAGCLYDGIVTRSADLYQIRSVTEVRRAVLKQQRRTKILKQVEETRWDHEVLTEAAIRLNLGRRYHTLHPSWMYWACDPFWSEVAGLHYLMQCCKFQVIPTPALPEGRYSLPTRFVAAKWYARHTFPYPDPDVSTFVRTTTATVAAQAPVVMLDTPDAFDDHYDIFVVGQNVTHFGADSKAHENVLRQAQAIGAATGLVGTYGGVAQLALRMGKPAVSFYHTWGGTAHAHLALNSWLSKQQQTPFLVGSLVDHHLWSQVTSVPTPVVAPMASVDGVATTANPELVCG